MQHADFPVFEWCCMRDAYEQYLTWCRTAGEFNLMKSIFCCPRKPELLLSDLDLLEQMSCKHTA